MTRALSTMPTPSGQMAVSNWRDFQKNSLQGFFTLTTPAGLVIHGCSYFVREDGKRGVGVPQRPLKSKTGETTYTPVIEFRDDQTKRRFEDAALDAVDRYLGSLAGRGPR
jgi:hypothetical protein